LLKAPIARGGRGVNVTQGESNSVASSLGSAAVFHPPLLNPGLASLMTIPEVWGHRRDRWELHGGFPGTSDGHATYPVALPYRSASTLKSNGVCGLHFIFDGPAFEILFSGASVWVSLIVDGEYVAPGIIRTTLNDGVAGAPLDAYDALLRFDFGSAATRHISVYALSSRGPCAIVTGPNDRLEPWDRSGEASIGVMADSYGGGAGPDWRGGAYFEAAARLGIPHLDLDSAGGTGYAINTGNADSLDPGNVFRARLPGIVDAQPDLFLTAGGINDNNAFAMPPTFPTGADALASFNAAVGDYHVELRRRLPQAVLASIGPWSPNASFPTHGMARSKADTIKAALQAVGGPWVFIDNLDGSWVNSAGASGLPTGPWQTGTGTSAAPNGTGNGDLYLSQDGVHPNPAGFGYLGMRIANDLRAALLAM
jgi:lysophospholipase L1-like esterase